MPAQKPGRSKQDYGTPTDFLVMVKGLLGIREFVIDLAADDTNAKATAFYTVEDNALTRPWFRGYGWNWLNPPFGTIWPWVQAAWGQWEEHHAQTAMLIPAAVGSNWWREWVHNKAQVLLLNGRLTFEGTAINPKTGKVDPYIKDCALLLYGRPKGYWIWGWKQGLKGIQ